MEHASKWKVVLKISVVHEKRLYEDKYIVHQIVTLLKAARLFSTFTSSKKYSALLVRLVIVNLTKDFGNSASPSLGEVLVRGKNTMIMHNVINKYYNSLNAQHTEPEPDFSKVTCCITADEKTSWVENKMSSTDKSTKYSMLNTSYSLRSTRTILGWRNLLVGFTKMFPSASASLS